MRRLKRYASSGFSALVLAALAGGSAPGCGGSDADDGATLDDTDSSGGSGGSGGSGNGAITGNGGSIIVTTNAGGASNSTSSSTAGEGGSGADCGGQTVNAEPIQVNLLLVIDRSGSMTDTPDGFDDDKWTTMVGSLNTALDGIAGTMSVGIQFFPDADADDASGCGMPNGSDVAVPIADGQDAIAAVKSALASSDNTPDGNTPAADALELAHRYFTEGAGADLEGNNYVLLALDGGPNCDAGAMCGVDSCTVNIDQPDLTAICTGQDGSCCGDGSDATLNESCLDSSGTKAQVEALADAGITTFVVGIPGSDQAAYETLLDELAVLGGAPASSDSPQFYQVADATELSSTLVALTSDLVDSCELILENPPPDEEKVNVIIDGETLAKTGDDGWEFDDPENPTAIIIKGETCTTIETEGVQSVSVEYGCPTIYDIPK